MKLETDPPDRTATRRLSSTGIGSARPLRVSLLDSSELVTTGFATMLAPHTERVRVVQQPQPETALVPCDLLLVDFTLLPPALVEDLLLRACAAARVVSYSWSGRPPNGPWWSAAERRVSGHVAKSLPAARLIDRLEGIHRGSPGDGVGARSEGGGRSPRRTSFPTLTPRERDIVSRIARGMSNAEIAEQLFLSINSVKTYVRTAYRKMGVATRSQAVARWFAGELEADRNGDASPDAAARVRATS